MTPSGAASAPSRSEPGLVEDLGPDLRAPLHAILGLGEALRAGNAGRLSSAQTAYVEDILTNGRRLLRLVNDAVDLARLEAGAHEFHAEPVSPAALVRDVCEIVRALAVRKRIAIVSEIDPRLAEVSVDAAALRQVLFDRVSSALQLAPAHGRVAIRVSAEPAGSFRVAVEPGAVAPADQCGLDVTREQRIVEAQGGRVGVARESGRGSVFFAVFPG